MDKRLYPSAKNVIPTSQIETTPTAADYIETFRDNFTQKGISLANLFALPPTFGRINLTETVYTASGAISPNVSFVALNGAGKLEMTIAAPAAGRILIITQKDTRTDGHTITLSSGTWDGTNDVATLDAAFETLVVLGLSATRFLVLVNLGSVSFS